MSFSHQVSRRSVLRVAGAAASAAALAACGAAATPQVVKETVVVTQEVEKVVEKEVTTVVEATPQVVKETVVVEKEVTAAPSEVSGTVSMWVFPLTQDDMGALWNPLVARFNQTYANVSVSVELLPWDGRREKIMTAFAAGEPPDMAYVNTDTISLFGMNDVLVPLDDVIPQEIWDDVYGNLTAGLSWDGKKLMFPTLLIAEGYIYNKGLFTEVGADPEKPPETWDDLQALGDLGKAKSYYLTRQYPSDWDTYIQWVWQAGGNIFDPDVTKVQLTSDPAKEALTFLKDFFVNGWVPRECATASATDQAQASNSISYWITGRQLLSDQSNANITTNTTAQNPDIVWGQCPVFKNKRQVTVGGAGCWGVFKGARNFDTTKEWLLWLVAPEQQGFYGSVTGFAPPRKAAWNFWATDPGPRAFYEVELPYLEMNQDTNYFYNESATIIGPYFQAVVLERSSVDEALQMAQDEIQAMVDEWQAKRKAG